MFTQKQVWMGIESLARGQGWSVSRLAIEAGLDPTALNRSKRFGNAGRPRWPSTETLSRVLGATRTSLPEFHHLMQAAAGDD